MKKKSNNDSVPSNNSQTLEFNRDISILILNKAYFHKIMQSILPMHKKYTYCPSFITC